MDWSAFAGAVLGSGIVTGIVSIIGKYISDKNLESFKAQLKLDTDKQLTQLKAELESANATELERAKTNLKLRETVQSKQLSAYEALAPLLTQADVLLVSAIAFNAFYVFPLPDEILENFRMIRASITSWVMSNEIYMDEAFYKRVQELHNMLRYQVDVLSSPIPQPQTDQSWRENAVRCSSEIRELEACIRTTMREQIGRFFDY